MVYKQVATIGAYNIPGRGQVLMTLDRTIQPGEIIEAENKTWRVTSVELSNSQQHIGLCVVPFTESDAKQATARDARSLLDALFSPELDKTPNDAEASNPALEIMMTDPMIGVIQAKHAKQKQQHLSPDEQKMKLIQVLHEMNTHMTAIRDWALQRLGEFDLGKEPPAVFVMVVSMPRDGMSTYVEKLQTFLVQSMDVLEKEGKLPWANVKAIAGCKQPK
jgi:hypothetical protein